MVNETKCRGRGMHSEILAITVMSNDMILFQGQSTLGLSLNLFVRFVRVYDCTSNEMQV